MGRCRLVSGFDIKRYFLRNSANNNSRRNQVAAAAIGSWDFGRESVARTHSTCQAAVVEAIGVVPQGLALADTLGQNFQLLG